MISARGFYDVFHRGTSAAEALLDEGNLTYGNLVAFLGRHLRADADVLDVGCGNGVLSMYAASRGCRVLGLDVSPTAVAAATAGAARLGIRDVAFLVADFERFTSADRFDAVLCFDILEHFPDDLGALARMVGLLRPGGTLLLRVPTTRAPVHRARMALFGRGGFDESVGHVHRYCPVALTRLLFEAGFRVVETEPVEGPVRNFLYTARTAHQILRYAKWRRFATLLTAVDQVALRAFGPAGVNVAAVLR